MFAPIQIKLVTVGYRPLKYLLQIVSNKKNVSENSEIAILLNFLKQHVQATVINYGWHQTKSFIQRICYIPMFLFPQQA